MPRPPALTLALDPTRCFRHDPAPTSAAPGPHAAQSLPSGRSPLLSRRATSPAAGPSTPPPPRRKLRIGDFKLNVEIPFTTKKPKDPLLYVATGGTISATGSRHTYEAGKLTGQDCLRGVRLPHNVAVEVVNLFAKDSKDIEAQDWQRLRNLILQRIGNVRGVVISHGTDTLAHTAAYLHWTLPPDNLAGKKVVLTGAMRPASDPQADGPANLSDAFFLAKSRKGQGVLATMAGRIYAPPGFAKKHTTSVHAFQPVNGQAVGAMRWGRPSLTRPPEPPPRTFRPGDAPLLPAVAVIHAEPGVAPADTIGRIRHAVRQGAQGIVYAGTGNGTIHGRIEPELRKQADAGRLVVRASGVGDGEVIRNGAFQDDQNGVACAGRLGPDQARLLAQLALAEAGPGRTPEQTAALRRVFDPYQSPRQPQS